MTDTALAVVKRVMRKLGLEANIVSFSDNDESQWLVDRLNERYQELCRLLPQGEPYLSKSGSLSITSGQRLCPLVSDLYYPELYLWSVSYAANDITKLEYRTLEQICLMDSSYLTKQGQPQYIYADNGQLALYPIPFEAGSLNFSYRPQLSTISLPTDELQVPSPWLQYIQLGMEFDYQIFKVQGQPDITLARLNQVFMQIVSELFRLRQTQFKAEA